jgi:hypothetical protein
MPLDSAQVAQMTGMYQSQAMNQLAYSQQIGMGGAPQFGGQNNGAFGDRMMGGMMNAAGAMGSPMMSAMGTLAPMGISAGLGLGMLGSTGVGIPIAAGLAGAQYAGGQMFTGAQQQQNLNQSLRSFGGMNQFGGQGLGRSDMTQIGGVVRSMSEQFGPGGQITGMNELSSLAGKMGQMGLAQGVRDVQEFSKKFKETITALKSMAKDLGTTLEGAMEFASSARGSGIFGMQNASRFTSMARGTAAAGGLAMSEVTSMANIGSQISRSVGGLGRQGALAGMRTIGQVGTAQQMGILSDEDIYNTTGQSGAEGRQAFAAAQMQKSANFLRSGRGRRMLASMADVNGNLDPTGVGMIMSGGMGVGETMGMDRQRVTGAGAPVNRANFIRNEGRLRGAAMQEFGAFLPAMQMQQWAQSKGVDINNMDDRSMLFMQRQLGMGRDEADSTLKMAQNMPRIMEEMRSKQGRDSFQQDFSQQRGKMGVEGIKQRLEQARETVNSKLQKVGQDFFNEGSDMIESFMSRLTGAYTQRFSEDAENAYRAASMGGSRTASENLSRYTNVGRGGGGGAGLGGGAAALGRGADLRGGRGGSIGGTALAFFGGGESDLSKFGRAGFSLDGVGNNQQLSARLAEISGISRAASQPPDARYVSLGATQPEWLQEAFTNGSVHGQGQDRIRAFDSAIRAKGSAQQKAAWSSAKTDAERARIMSGLREGAGLGNDGANFAVPELKSQFYGEGMTEAQRRDLLGKAFTGGGESKTHQVLRGMAAGALGYMMGGNAGGPLVGGFIERMMYKYVGGGEKNAAIGAFLDSKEATDAFARLSQGDTGFKTGLQKEIADLRGRGDREKLSEQDQARMEGLQGVMAASEVEKAGGASASNEAIAAIATKYNLTVDQVRARYGSVREAEGRKASEYTRGLALSVGGQASKRLDGLTAAGIAEYQGGKLTLKDASKMGTQARDIAGKLLDAVQSEASAGISAKANDLQSAGASLDAARETRSGVGNQLAGMTVAEKRKVAGELARAGLSDEARSILSSAAGQDRLGKLNKKRGADAAISQFLGIDIDPEVAKAMKGATAEEKARLLAMSAGAGGNANIIGDLSGALGSLKKGDTGHAAQTLSALAASPEFQDAIKKKSLDKAAQENPLQDAMNKNLEKMVATHQQQLDILKIIGKHTGNAADEIAKLEKKDPETPGGKT